MKYATNFLLLSFFTFLSCGNGAIDIKKQIIGTWDVYGSEINNKPNGFMAEAWFTFNADNTVKSNLFEDGYNRTYHIDADRLVIDSDVPLDLQIAKLENDTLHLKEKSKFTRWNII